jgi:rSAM/selenodomain-associated transferase 2
VNVDAAAASRDNTLAMTKVPALSVVIPTLNAAARLRPCLKAVKAWPGALEIVVIDGGSDDDTVAIAHAQDAKVLPSERGRGLQLERGGAAAKSDWLLFLHADTVLAPAWTQAALAMMRAEGRARAATFRLRLDDPSPAARRVERLVAWRCERLGLPYGDQGLLIPRALYDSVGGYRKLPLMEDVDLIRRIGRGNVVLLGADAVTSAVRYRRDGWWWRPSRNLFCLALYFLGLPLRWIAKVYG